MLAKDTCTAFDSASRAVDNGYGLALQDGASANVTTSDLSGNSGENTLDPSNLTVPKNP